MTEPTQAVTPGAAEREDAQPSQGNPDLVNPVTAATAEDAEHAYPAEDLLPGALLGTADRVGAVTVGVQIRLAERSDLPALVSVYQRASLSNEPDRANLLAHPEFLEFRGGGIVDGRTTVAVVGGVVVGFATVSGVAPLLELEDLFVDPGLHRQGIATALVQDVVDRARRAGGTSLDVIANDAALGFYTSAGFEQFGVASTEFGVSPRLRRDL